MKTALHVIACVATGWVLAALLFWLFLAFTDGTDFPQ